MTDWMPVLLMLACLLLPLAQDEAAVSDRNRICQPLAPQPHTFKGINETIMADCHYVG